MKSRDGKSQRREGKKKQDQRRERLKKDPGARKGRKVAKHCVFPMVCGSGGSKSRLTKAEGAEPSGGMRDEKMHAVVARCTFASENVQSTLAPDDFWKLRCRKSERRCGAKKQGFGALLDVPVSFCVAGARDSALCPKSAKREGFVAASTSTTIALHYTPLHYTATTYNYNYSYGYNYTTLH